MKLKKKLISASLDMGGTQPAKKTSLAPLQRERACVGGAAARSHVRSSCRSHRRKQCGPRSSRPLELRTRPLGLATVWVPGHRSLERVHHGHRGAPREWTPGPSGLASRRNRGDYWSSLSRGGHSALPC